MPAVVAAVVLMGSAACARGPNSANGSGSTASARPTPSEAYQLLPDGSVPWNDEPITDEQLQGPPRPARSPAPGTTSCRADQLAGVLRAWTRPRYGGERPRGFDAPIGKLIGEVEVRNTSPRACTLQGRVPTEMFAGGRRVPMLYTDDINAEAARRVVVVPAGGRATLRLDWSGPFCRQISGRRELVIQLPNGGGALHAPVRPTDTPNCPGGEAVNPNARATLYASGFSEPVQVSKSVAAPLAALTVTVSGPTTAHPGQRLEYLVRLGNPTAKDVRLEPCPAYYVELFSMGDATNQAVNQGQLYRLNCRPVDHLAPRRAVSFRMVAQVPAGLASGREFIVTWKLMLPHFTQGPKQWGVLHTRTA
jgi:hypothetical protein